MKIAGTSQLHAAPEKVWAAITDPAVLASVIPGCQKLTPIAENHFGLTVSMGVAAIRGTYAGEVKLYDMTRPTSLTMRAAGAGGPGTVDTTVQVTLTDQGDGTTKLDYDATATVGGPAGGVGQRVLSSVAKKTAGLFFSAIDDVLTGKKAVTAAAGGAPGAGAASGADGAMGAAAGGGATAAVPAASAAAGAEPVASAPAGTEPVAASPVAAPAAPAFGTTLAPPSGGGAAGPFAGANSLAAVLIGAAAALIGVLVGAKIARRR